MLKDIKYIKLEYHMEQKENGAEEIFEIMSKTIPKLGADTKTIVPKIPENAKQGEYQKLYIQAFHTQS